MITGCGGGSGNSTTTSTGPDMGTPATVSDSYQYTQANAASSLVLGMNQSQAASASVVQEPNPGSTDALWHFIPMNNNEYNVENLLTHQVMGVQSASTAAGAQVLQYADNGTSDHLWEFYLLTDGNYLIKNANSALYLEDTNSGTTPSATIDQGARPATGTDCTCQEWKLTSTGTSPYTNPISVTVSYTSTGDSSSTGIHDPSLLKAGSTYYLFSTHGTIHAHTSIDRVNFSDDGYALSSLPAWTNTYTASSGDLWAPDALEHNGVYWLYYAASTFGSSNSTIVSPPAPTVSLEPSPIPAHPSISPPIAPAPTRSTPHWSSTPPVTHGWSLAPGPTASI
ncbi:MAG: RICIN domain-containing protein [Terracidiphilus sp.]